MEETSNRPEKKVFPQKKVGNEKFLLVFGQLAQKKGRCTVRFMNIIGVALVGLVLASMSFTPQASALSADGLVGSGGLHPMCDDDCTGMSADTCANHVVGCTGTMMQCSGLKDGGWGHCYGGDYVCDGGPQCWDITDHYCYIP